MRRSASMGMRGLLPSATSSTSTVTAAYSLTDRQALRVAQDGSDPTLASPRVASESRFSKALTFKPYRYGHSDPSLRPVV